MKNNDGSNQQHNRAQHAPLHLELDLYTLEPCFDIIRVDLDCSTARLNGVLGSVELGELLHMHKHKTVQKKMSPRRMREWPIRTRALV